MKFLAITLARAGSKRIKNKNLLKISGTNLLEISYLNSIKSKKYRLQRSNLFWINDHKSWV